VTKLLQRLHEELVRRHYAASTIQSYSTIVEAFRHHVGKRLTQIGPDDLRRTRSSSSKTGSSPSGPW
jgi:hypothetical protein